MLTEVGNFSVAEFKRPYALQEERVAGVIGLRVGDPALHVS